MWSRPSSTRKTRRGSSRLRVLEPGREAGQVLAVEEADDLRRADGRPGSGEARSRAAGRAMTRRPSDPGPRGAEARTVRRGPTDLVPSHSSSGTSTHSFRENGERRGRAGGQEREQPRPGLGVERRPVLGDLERLDVPDSARRPRPVGPDDEVAVSVGQRADAAGAIRSASQARRSASSFGHLVEVAGVVGEPLVELRLVAVEHADEAIERRPRCPRRRAARSGRAS